MTDFSNPGLGDNSLRFLSLPRQVRNTIYDLLLARDHTINLAPYRSTQVSFLPLRYYHSNPQFRRDDIFLNPLLRVNRQVRHEALSVICSNSVFFTNSISRLITFLGFLGPRVRRRLGAVNVEILPFYDGGYDEQTRDRALQAVELLQECKSLWHLKIDLATDFLVHWVELGYCLRPFESISSIPVIAALSQLRGIEEVVVRWTEYEDDWSTSLEHTFFRNCVMAEGLKEVVTLRRQVTRWLRKAIAQPKGSIALVKNHEATETKPFPFLELPRELRDNIYSLILEGPNPIILSGPSLGQNEDYPIDTTNVPESLLHHSLLLVSHQVRGEALDVLYSTNTFKATSQYRLQNFLSSLDPALRERIRKLELWVVNRIGKQGEEFAEAFRLLAECTQLNELSLLLDESFLLEETDDDDTYGYCVCTREEILKSTLVTFLSRDLRAKRVSIKWLPFSFAWMYSSSESSDPDHPIFTALIETKNIFNQLLRNKIQVSEIAGEAECQHPLNSVHPSHQVKV